MEKIYNYDDYQNFLADFYDEKKSTASYFSFRYMADRTGLDAGFLSKVCGGKIHLTLKSIEPLAQFIGLNERETDFFRLLVKFGRAVEASEIKLYYEEIMAFRGIDMARVSDQFYAFYQKWYHTAIRAVLAFYPFSGDYEALAQKLSPPISVEEAKSSIDLLCRIGFVVEEGGRFTLAEKHITTGDKWRTGAIHLFQEECIDLAKQSLTIHDKSLRDISSVTISVNHADLEELRELAKNFRRQVMQLQTGNGPSDMVYQINVQIIPMSSKESE